MNKYQIKKENLTIHGINELGDGVIEIETTIHGKNCHFIDWAPRGIDDYILNHLTPEVLMAHPSRKTAFEWVENNLKVSEMIVDGLKELVGEIR